MESRTRLVLAAIAVATALVVAACDIGATPTPQSDAEAAVCDALQVWSDEMNALEDLSTSDSIEEFQAQADVVAAAWDDVKVALEGVESADRAAVEAGGEALAAALGDFSTDVPVTEAWAELQAAAEPLKAAYKEMADGMSCAIATPY